MNDPALEIKVIHSSRKASKRSVITGEVALLRVFYTVRVAASASSASCLTVWKNFGDCPTNRPSAVNDAIVATAPPNLSSLGRITAQRGNFALMNSHGTGKIRLGCINGLSGLKKLGNFRPDILSVNGATGA